MALVADSQVTDELLARYATLIYDVTGIRISQQKKTLLSNRVRRRLRETGIPDFEQYFQNLKRLKVTDPEWDAFLQEITTHETYLFRDEANWQWLQQSFLPQVADAARKGTRAKTLRIWSAACSTGDEAYTIASCIATCLTGYETWNVKILGTDIGCDAVDKAKKAQFGARAMRLVPDDMQKKLFTKLPDGQTWEAKPQLKRMTEFRRHNLLEPLREAPFDLVLVKNVLIYFDTPSKQIVMNNVRKVLAPGSMLIAGAAEGIADMLKDMTRHQPWLYSKV